MPNVLVEVLQSALTDLGTVLEHKLERESRSGETYGQSTAHVYSRRMKALPDDLTISVSS